ncbi:MAG: tetratricopeptide repeat protein [Ardenticatenaceae bacterium]|nr:tetratricopeptide repeat protein [Ardenticatenaceae bacterium]
MAASPSEGEGWGEGENERLDGLERKSETWQQAADLAAALGRLPLALEHAAAYVASKGSSYASYHQLFNERQNELWQRAEKPERYHATITTTWELAFDEIKKTPGALELLNLCCFLDPESVPLALIYQISTVKAQHAAPLQAVVADELALDDALGALRRYSLVQKADGALALHRLVQAVARSRMDEDLSQSWLETAVKLLVDQFNYDQNDMRSWAYCGELLPHVTFAVNLAEQVTYETSSVAYLNNEGGRYLQFFGNFAATKPFLERAAQIYESISGSEHPHTATSLNNLGFLLKAMGDLPAARPFFERALAIYEKALGPDHPDTALSLNNLGFLLKAMGDLPAARPFYEYALAIREKALGPDHPDTAQSLNNLGFLLRAMGDLPAARPFYERALAIREKALGPDHPDTAQSLNNLGLLLKAMGDLAAARQFYERALAITENALGPDHPTTAIRLNNLAWLAHDEGDFAEAARLMRQALAILEKRLGPDHPDTVRSRNNLAAIEAKISS